MSVRQNALHTLRMTHTHVEKWITVGKILMKSKQMLDMSYNKIN